MKIVQINSMCGSGSTGRICVGISEMLRSKGHDSFVFYGLGHSDYKYSEKISSTPDYYLHNISSRLFDCEGLCSVQTTRKLINRLIEIKPDVVHLHNLHGHYINYKLLFEFIILNPQISVVVTMHDCWTFTGHCAHFINNGCDNWKTGCRACPFPNSYPSTSFMRRSRKNYLLKQTLYEPIKERMVLVPVSYWLNSFLPDSMFNGFRSVVVHNGIDLSVFHPDKSKKEKIVLGVANPWSAYKGLEDFYQLRKLLPIDTSIVLVGLSDEQLKTLPEGIVGHPPTSSIQELIRYYSTASVLVNTTYCDNYPTVNLEAIACGTPVITYKTGGSPESISEGCGMVVPQGDVVAMADAVRVVMSKEEHHYTHNCIEYAKAHFNKDACFLGYLDVYQLFNKE